MILVTGAAGKTGLAVLRALQALGAPRRGLVRSELQADAVSALGAEPVIGDMQGKGVLAAAMQGARAVYLICPNVHRGELEIGTVAIKAAKDAGVERFVFHSVLYPQIEAMPHHWLKLRVEEQLIASGLDFAILQPASYMQNILPYIDTIRISGEYLVPYSVDSVFTPVDLHDVAEVAAKVLTTKEHSHAIYALAGPQKLSSKEMAKAAGVAVGIDAKAVEQPIKDWQRAARANKLDDYAIDTLSKMFAFYDEHGFGASSFTLDALLGRRPTSFEEFLRRELKLKIKEER
jgi:NAD(P)H dehydrogenase (quinone)